MAPAVLDALVQARERTLGLVAHLDDEQLERVIDAIMSPLAWDLGHIAAYEDLWINHRQGRLPLLRADLAALYDAFETPRKVRGGLRFLRGGYLLEYMEQATSCSTPRRCCSPCGSQTGFPTGSGTHPAWTATASTSSRCRRAQL